MRESLEILAKKDKKYLLIAIAVLFRALSTKIRYNGSSIYTLNIDLRGEIKDFIDKLDDDYKYLAYEIEGVALASMQRYDEAIECFTEAYIRRDALQDKEILYCTIRLLASTILQNDCSLIDPYILLIEIANKLDKDLATRIKTKLGR